jgi:thiamine biosynthesis protein ThiS
MQLIVNDKPRDVPDDLTLDALLQHLEISSRFTAVAHNGTIVRRDEYTERQLREGDRLEIVTMVGGG